MARTGLGVIEGFYGRPYAAAARLDLMRFLARARYDFYIYAPKNAAGLRRSWRAFLSGAELEEQAALRAAARRAGLLYGVGISPLGICGALKEDLPCLQEHVRTLLCRVRPDYLCLLFDDITAAPGEAERQNQVIRALDVQCRSRGAVLIVCPTYYSLDPVLERVFGPAPADYFTALTADLPGRIAFFWTGSRVLSPDITLADLEAARSRLPEVVLWDNYPVNDGKKLCDRLFISPFRGRAGLDGEIALHAVNPMTEPYLSRISLVTLPLIYRGAGSGELRRAASAAGEELFDGRYETVRPFLEKIETEGRLALDPAELEQLERLCRSIDTPAAAELRDFLNGGYAFDPACLTS